MTHISRKCAPFFQFHTGKKLLQILIAINTCFFPITAFTQNCRIPATLAVCHPQHDITLIMTAAMKITGGNVRVDLVDEWMLMYRFNSHDPEKEYP